MTTQKTFVCIDPAQKAYLISLLAYNTDFRDAFEVDPKATLKDWGFAIPDTVAIPLISPLAAQTVFAAQLEKFVKLNIPQQLSQFDNETNANEFDPATCIQSIS